MSCSLGPFQLVPYSNDEPATQFKDLNNNRLFQSCSLVKPWSKFPNQTLNIDLTWLNESYVNLTVLNGTLYFKVSITHHQLIFPNIPLT